MEVKLEQWAKAELPIDVTELGIVMEVKPQLSKTELSIDVTELGIVMEVKPEQ
jgi:metal-sulfur cluster biosynthetic enzyme